MERIEIFAPYPEDTVSVKKYWSIDDVKIDFRWQHRKCQEAYNNEIKSLRSGKAVSRKRTIYKASPYFDDIGVLREKGRIDAMEGFATSVQRPIIMPHKDSVSHLLGDFYHRKYHHHSEAFVNKIGQRFRTKGLRALVEAISNKCQVGKNRAAKSSCPELADVPSEYLALFAMRNAPF